MILDALKRLEDYIMEYNKYFVESFYKVSMDPKGYIMFGDSPVFPADEFGNYFYLRIPNNYQFDYDKQYILHEGDSNIGIKIPVILIACVHGGDPDVLLENLITTLQQYQPDDIKFTSATSQKEIVIAQELAKIKKENLEAAQQKIDPDYALASISFTFTTPYEFKNLNCIKAP